MAQRCSCRATARRARVPARIPVAQRCSPQAAARWPSVAERCQLRLAARRLVLSTALDVQRIRLFQASIRELCPLRGRSRAHWKLQSVLGAAGRCVDGYRWRALKWIVRPAAPLWFVGCSPLVQRLPRLVRARALSRCFEGLVARRCHRTSWRGAAGKRDGLSLFECRLGNRMEWRDRGKAHRLRRLTRLDGFSPDRGHDGHVNRRARARIRVCAGTIGRGGQRDRWRRGRLDQWHSLHCRLIGKRRGRRGFWSHQP